MIDNVKTTVVGTKMIVEVDCPGKGKVRQAGISIKLSETPGKIRNLGVSPGESTSEILTELGYSKEEIKELQETGVTGTGSS